MYVGVPQVGKNMQELLDKLHNAFFAYNLTQLMGVLLFLTCIFVCWLLSLLFTNSAPIP